MLEGVVWSLPYAKDWQSCCAASQVCRAHCKKVVLAGAQVCLVMTGGCPQVFLVAGWFELCAIIQKQPAADLYLLSKSQWSAYSSHLQAETVNAFLVWVRETHDHYWAVIQGPNQQTITSKCMLYSNETVQSWSESPDCSWGALYLAFPVHFKAAWDGDGHVISSCFLMLSTYSLLDYL